MKSYRAITPARDEQKFLPALIDCMAAQTRTPQRWILIDDGSSDATGSIIDEAARRYAWIEPHHLARDRARKPGGESVTAQFLQPHVWRDVDYIFRVDADITFGPDFVERLLGEFARDPRLGIASGRTYEFVGGRWRECRDPAFHTSGTNKLYATACFAAIGGHEPVLGFDTIDAMRAMMRGFTTRNCPGIHVFHHRPQGSAAGLWRGRLNSGRAAFYVGYSPLFMLARTARNLFQRPFVIGAMMLMAGYLEGYVRRSPMVADAELIRFVRRQQLRRLTLRESVWR